MKMLYIANVRIPTEKAHGHQIMKMAEVLVLAGADVTLIVPDRKNNKEFKNINSFDFYSIKKIFKLIKLKSYDPTFLFKFPAGFYVKLQSLSFMLRLTWFLIYLKNRRDYYHYTRDEYLLPLLTKFSKKVIWESHALPRNINIYLKSLERCHKIVVLTGEIKNQLIKAGISGDKIMVSPDAVDLAIFDIDVPLTEAKNKLALPADKIILGYTGSLKTKGMDKGVADALKALKALPHNIILVAVGGNVDDTRFYKNMADDLGVGGRVKFLPKVSQSELAIYQKAFDILLMPFPYTKHYAFFMSPLKMFEYMASRRPIIASDLPAIREVLSEKNCIFCQPDSSDDLAQKINLLLSDKVLAEKLSGQAYQDVKKYTWLERGKKIVEFMN